MEDAEELTDAETAESPVTYIDLEPEEDTEDSENVDTFVNEASENEFEEISEDTDMAE